MGGWVVEDVIAASLEGLLRTCTSGTIAPVPAYRLPTDLPLLARGDRCAIWWKWQAAATDTARARDNVIGLAIRRGRGAPASVE